MEKKLKILVIRFSSIGDIVLTFHALRCLKEKHPNAEVHFLTKSTYKELLLASTFHDKTLFFEGDLKQTKGEIRKENYSHIIDLHNNLRTRLLTVGISGVQLKRLVKLNWKKWLLTRLKKNKLPNKHVVDRYIDAFTDLDVKSDHKNTAFFVPITFEIELNRYDLRKKSFLAIAMGAQYRTKKFPVASLIEVIESYDLPIVLLGGHTEQEDSKKIQAAFPQKKMYNLCGELSLLASASILSQAKTVLTNDTGLMHIAAMFDVPIVSIWGNTVPAFGMSPYRPGNEKSVKIHEVVGLNCRPCSKIGYQECPKGHFKCMEKQDLSAIATDIKA
jgi:ADP-heptose:LPS heptosyltransferase